MRYFSFFFLMLFSLWGKSQNYPISSINITLPNNPSAQISDWATGVPPLTIVAQSKLVNGQIDPQVVESRVLVTIKSGTQKICGTYTIPNAPMSGFNAVVKTWVGVQAIGLLGGNCTVQPGEYLFCVQFFSSLQGNKALSNEICKPFTIKGKETQKFSPPVNITPADKKSFTEKEIKTPITFRWTPVVPKPNVIVKYKLRVWQLMQGQNSTQAMRSNPPIVTKEVDNITQANIPNLNGEPCMLPYLCSYVWNVEASKTNPLGEVEMLGSSEATGFGVAEKDSIPIKINPPVNQAPVDGKVFTEKEASQPIVLRWSPVLPKPNATVIYTVRVIEVKKGESRAQAIKNNKPVEILETKNETQVISKLAKSCNGCEYIWNVEASKKNPLGEVEILGSSEATAFGVSNFNCDPNLSIKVTDSVCLGEYNGMYKYHICFDATYSSGSIDLTYTDPTSGIKAYMPVSPFTNYTISGASVVITQLHGIGITVKNYCFDVLVPMSETTIRIGLQGDDRDPDPNNTCKPGATTDLKLPSCKCTSCDQLQWTLPDLIKYDTSWKNGTNNIMTLYGNLNIGPQKVVKISTEIVDFYWYTEGDCKKCANNDYYFGNLISGSATGLTATSVGYEGIPLISSHQIDFVSPTLAGVNINSNFNLNISLPPQTQLGCCTDCFRFCIRYTATFMDGNVCKMCSIVKCYETKRKHRQTVVQMWPQPNQCGDILFPPNGGGTLINGTKLN